MSPLDWRSVFLEALSIFAVVLVALAGSTVASSGDWRFGSWISAALWAAGGAVALRFVQLRRAKTRGKDPDKDPKC